MRRQGAFLPHKRLSFMRWKSPHKRLWIRLCGRTAMRRHIASSYERIQSSSGGIRTHSGEQQVIPSQRLKPLGPFKARVIITVRTHPYSIFSSRHNDISNNSSCTIYQLIIFKYSNMFVLRFTIHTESLLSR